MKVTEHQRPGVYSVYEASNLVSGRSGGRGAGVVAVNGKGAAGKVVTVSSREQAVETFGTEGKMAALVGLLLENGAIRVHAVAVADPEGYAAGFQALETVEDVAVGVCDSDKRASESRRERLAVVFGGEGETAQALVERAAGLNSERVVLVGPGGAEAAAAVAGVLAGESDPAVPLGGASLTGVTPAEGQWSDGEMDTLILGGVTPLETLAGTVSVVRGVTTRTTTGSAPDGTWRELSAIRVVDRVIPDLRDALRARFSRAKNTPQGREAIRSQVIVELEREKSLEIITGYDNVAVR